MSPHAVVPIVPFSDLVNISIKSPCEVLSTEDSYDLFNMIYFPS